MLLKRMPVLLLLQLGLIFVTTLVFMETPSLNFVGFDDEQNVTNNPLFHPVSAEHLLHFWRVAYYNLYVPLTYNLWGGITLLAHQPHPFMGADGDLIQVSPMPFHLTNLVLHLCNVLLVFHLVRLLLSLARPESRRIDGAAAIGALFFAIHPLQVEAVAWVSELRGVLSTFFSLLTLLLFARFRTQSLPARRWGSYFFATITLTLALLSKPSAAAVPLVAIAVDWWISRWFHEPRSKSLFERFVSLLVWVIIVAVFILRTQTAQPVPDDLHLPFWQRPLIAGDALTFYLTKIILPIQLAVDYGRSPSVALGSFWIYVTGLLPWVLGIGIWLSRRKQPGIFAAVCIFIASLTPLLGFVPFVFQTFSTVADRYTYLAMTGIALLVAVLVDRFWNKTVLVSLGLVFLLLGVLSSIQVVYWDNSLALFTHSLEVNPKSGNIRYNLANFYSKHGQADTAISLYRASLVDMPNNDKAHYNLGRLLELQGKSAEASEQYQQAVRLAPNSEIAWVNLGNSLMGIKKLPDAIDAYHAALQLDPNDAQAYNNLGLAYSQQGQFLLAIDTFRSALKIDPHYAKAYYNLGNAYLGLGNKTSARDAFQTALSIEPNYTKAQNAINALSGH